LAEEKDVEQYWRGRASSLRTEIVTTDAQIEYVRNRLNEIPETPFLLGSPSYGPFGGIGPSVYPYGGIYPQGNGRITLGRPGYPGRNPYGRRQNRTYGGYGSIYPYGAGVNWPYQNYDYSYERSELRSQLDQLNRQRITLQVRWRELEEEARRAGAYPGWLRP
jgi:hypothetical protein